MNRLSIRKSAVALTIGVACVLSLGMSTAHAAPLTTQDRAIDALCTVGVDTVETCFPDPWLALAVAGRIGIAKTEVPTQAQLEGVQVLFTPQAVSSLEGVQLLTSLNSFGSRYGTFTELSPLSSLQQMQSIDISHGLVSDVSPLASLPALTSVNLAATHVRDVSMLPPTVTVAEWYDAIADSPEIPFTRGSVQGSVTLKSGIDGLASNFASTYQISGNVYAYVFSGGNGASTHLMHSSGNEPLYPDGPARSVLTPRGDIVTSKMDGLERRVERTVSSAGSILHTVTMTNPADAASAVTTRFYDSPDTELNGNDNVPILSDGNGGFYIEDPSITLYLQPASGIDQAFGGGFGHIALVRDVVEHGVTPSVPIASSAGIPAGDVIAENVDTAIYYVTPNVTLAPGDSYTYSYRETVFQADEDAQIQVDYVDDVTGDVVLNATQSFTGTVDTELTLDASNLVVPAGYELASSVSLPLTVTYGAQGPLTTVQISVHRAQTFTITFETQNGQAAITSEAVEGELVSLPADPTRDGFTFTGWTTDAAGKLAFDPSTVVTGDMTLYAQWQPLDSGDGDGNGGGNSNGDGNGNGGDTGVVEAPNGSDNLATTGDPALPLTGALAAAGIVLGLAIMARRRRA